MIEFSIWLRISSECSVENSLPKTFSKSWTCFTQNAKRLISFVLLVERFTNLLKTSLLRPDQIYSVDFGEDGSILRKFSSENPRESQNLEKMYLAGVFGGIPLYE